MALVPSPPGKRPYLQVSIYSLYSPVSRLQRDGLPYYLDSLMGPISVTDFMFKFFVVVVKTRMMTSKIFTCKS